MKLPNWIPGTTVLTSAFIVFFALSVQPILGAGKKPLIFTTFYPTQYFAQCIGGEYLTVINPVPDHEDAIFWQPSREALAQYQGADLIILNGAGFEKWVESAMLPEDIIVNTAAPIQESFIYIEGAASHSHGRSEEHSHAGLDGHTWVDPRNAIVQAGEIRKAFIQLLPAQKAYFDKSFEALQENLKQLDAALTAFMNGTRAAEPLIASHPAYNYIARRYKWNLVSFDLNPETTPTLKQLEEIKEKQKSHPAKFIIWESEPSTAAAASLKEACGLSSIVFNPCELLSEADRKAGKNYITVMRENVKQLEKVFENPGRKASE